MIPKWIPMIERLRKETKWPARLVEGYREGAKNKQRVLCNLGRKDGEHKELWGGGKSHQR